MKNKRKKILIVGIVLSVLLLSFWRIYPKSLEDVVRVDFTEVTSIKVELTDFGVKNGMAEQEHFNLLIESPDIISGLQEISFRQDYKNLLPWKIESVENFDYMVNFTLYGNNGNIESITMYFFNDNVITIHLDEFLFYHPVNDEAIEKVVEYIMEHGESC